MGGWFTPLSTKEEYIHYFILFINTTWVRLPKTCYNLAADKAFSLHTRQWKLDIGKVNDQITCEREVSGVQLPC